MISQVSAKGQSLLEILFAIALFSVGVVTIGYLIVDSSSSMRYGIEALQAESLAREGVVAVRTIRDDSFSRLIPGTYGVVLEDGLWALTPGSDTTGKFVRTVTIDEQSEGVREVVSTVLWDFHEGVEKQVRHTAHLTNWMYTEGDAALLEINPTESLLTASGTLLTGLTIRNTGERPISVVGMMVQWDSQALLTGVRIEGTLVFTASSSEAVPSHTEFEIAPYSLIENTGDHTIDLIEFTESVADSDFIITFIMSDESKRNVYVSL